jgi:hypothetical protein
MDISTRNQGNKMADSSSSLQQFMISMDGLDSKANGTKAIRSLQKSHQDVSKTAEGYAVAVRGAIGVEADSHKWLKFRHVLGERWKGLSCSLLILLPVTIIDDSAVPAKSAMELDLRKTRTHTVFPEYL